MRPINVISGFDGMGGAMEALTRAGIPVKNYYAFEIDKFAMKIASKNYPQIRHLYDITKWRFFDQIEIPDLIIGGSPCQGFSNAGLGLNFDDPRSRLFFEFADMIKYWKSRNPDLKFMLENVKVRKQEWTDIISNTLGVQPVLINSSLVSAQNRERYYWANWKITPPEDKHIYLKDIIEDGEVDRLKSYCIDANYWKGGNPKSYFEKGRRQLVFDHQSSKRAMVRIGTAEDIKGHDLMKRVYSIEGKSPTLNIANGGNRHPKIAVDEKYYRILTPEECEKLQTYPVGYSAGVSKTQRYKMLGNSYTIDVIVNNLQCMKKEMK